METKGNLREKVKPFMRKMKGIAHLHRLSIAYLLAYEPMEVWQIIRYTGLPENLASHHLKMMFEAGWVTRTKKGRNITYQLSEKAFFELFRLFSNTPFSKEVLSKYYKEWVE